MGLLENGIILIISDLLSLITILSCLVIKVPQIKIIQEKRSAVGVSLVSLLLELFSYSVTMSYNFCNGYRYLSYMEYPILLLQEYVLIFVVLKYQRLLGQKAAIGFGIYVIFLAGFMSGILPKFILMLLIPFTTPISASSKIMQLVAIVKSKRSDAISLVTWALSAFTNLTRIYTIYFDSADIMLLANFGISTLLSSLVFAAAWFYKAKPVYTKLKKEE